MRKLSVYSRRNLTTTLKLISRAVTGMIQLSAQGSGEYQILKQKTVISSIGSLLIDFSLQASVTSETSVFGRVAIASAALELVKVCIYLAFQKA